MRKILFKSENEALEFCYDMEFNNPEEIAYELKNKGYVEESKIEKAEKLIAILGMTAYDNDYYQKNKQLIDSHSEKIKILIDGFNELKLIK
jgi:uncharacterized protein with PhoU and TrkA domain